MSESKQTAVDWLRQELLKRDMDISIRELFNQAKEMDIQQKIEISKNSYIAGYLDNQSKIDDSMNFPNDYINETYGGNENE
jgi:hypothetical protein